MPYNISRKEFLRISALSSAGIILGCNSNASKKNTTSKKDNKNTPTLSFEKPVSEDVLFYKKDDNEYESLRKGFNKRIEKYPAIIALCKNTKGVAEAVQYARTHQLPITVKSGGHCFEGYSCNDNGMVINLFLMNEVVFWDAENIIVGPACTLERLYNKILPENRILPAGSCGGVGVAGLTLGGGYGLFSREFGLTCDSLSEVTMVDGMGNIHSSNNDKELLWACKGGGNANFGIVTEFKFKTVNAPVSFTSHRFKAFQLNASTAPVMLEKWFDSMKKLPNNCFSAFVLNGKTLTILLTNHGEHSVLIQQIINELSAFMHKSTIGTPKTLSTALKNYYGIQYPIFFKNASAGFYKDYNDIKNCIQQVFEIVTGTKGMIYQVNTLGGKINEIQFEVASSYPHRSYPFLSELQTYWDEPEQTDFYEKKFNEVQQIFLSNGITAQYRNYPDNKLKNWEQAYFGENYKRLQQIKDKYDPENNIRYEQSVRNSLKET